MLMANLGEILVIIGAAIWITGWIGACYVFVIGTLLFAIGRLMEGHPETQNVVLKRLYRQQIVGVFMLMASAALMLFYTGSRTAWLIPFIVFTVTELYTAFRIPSELKKEN